MSLLTLLDNPTRQALEDVWAELCRVYGDALTDRLLADARDCATQFRDPTERVNFHSRVQAIAAAVRDHGLYPELSAAETSGRGGITRSRPTPTKRPSCSSMGRCRSATSSTSRSSG
jgi:hypothetical protein